MRSVVIAFLLCLCLASFCFAQIQIKAEVDKNKLATDEELIYKLIISSSGQALPQPKFPEFKGFIVISQANTSNITIKGNSPKIGVIYVFIMVPKEAGIFTIEPTELKTKDATYKSESFQIEVSQAEGKSIPQESPETPQAPQDESPKEKIIL